MGFFDLFKKKKQPQQAVQPELYGEKEIDELEEYICSAFGQFDNVFHEIISPDIHADIAIINPTAEEPFYKLITMGMGAHRMNTPPELNEYQLQHAELVVYLPESWNISSEEEKDYWPLRWLKILARLPGEHNTWLGFGHTITAGGPVAENTGFSCMSLLTAYTKQGEPARLTMSNGKVIHFYQVFPLYEEEMNYKMEQGTIEKMLERFDGEMSLVVDIGRKNYCK